MEILQYGICQVSAAPIRASESDRSEIVSQLLFGELAEIMEVGKPWIKVRCVADGYVGYMDFKQLHYIDEADFEKNMRHMPYIVQDEELHAEGPGGIIRILIGSSLPFFDEGIFKIGTQKFTLILEEELTAGRTIAETASIFLNAPYLWGGRSLHGIDCSGYTQIVAKLHGYQLPRDASKQVHVGEAIEYADREIGDFVFFVNSDEHVHHVGILIEKNKILHASGWIREDKLDKKGIFREDFDEYTHRFHSIKRVL